jgi:hypothetical protein
MSLQDYATSTAGAARIRILDLAPDDSTLVMHPSGGPDGHRWTPEDGAPIELPERHYSDGAQMVMNDPVRFMPVAMPEAEHAALVAAFLQAKAAKEAGR